MISALTPQPQGITALWLILIVPTHERIGCVDLGGWLHIEINISHQELNPDMVTYPSTNQVRHTLTSLIKTNALPQYHYTRARPPWHIL